MIGWPVDGFVWSVFMWGIEFGIVFIVWDGVHWKFWYNFIDGWGYFCVG